MCETCERYKFLLSHGNLNEEERTKLYEEYHNHLKASDLGYASRSADHEEAKDNDKVSVADIDYGGGLRTPWVRYSGGYFKHIIPLQAWIIAGPKQVCFYCYDEKMVNSKSPNETLSMTYHWILAEKKRKPNLTRIIFWCDNCAGHGWNQYMMRFIHEVVDPTSMFYVKGITRIDIKASPSGHTYLWCDRVIAPVKRISRTMAEGIVCSFNTPALHALYTKRTWEYCIRHAKGAEAIPYQFIRAGKLSDEWSGFFDFKSYWNGPVQKNKKGKYYYILIKCCRWKWNNYCCRCY